MIYHEPSAGPENGYADGRSASHCIFRARPAPPTPPLARARSRIAFALLLLLLAPLLFLALALGRLVTSLRRLGLGTCLRRRRRLILIANGPMTTPFAAPAATCVPPAGAHTRAAPILTCKGLVDTAVWTPCVAFSTLGPLWPIHPSTCRPYAKAKVSTRALSKDP